MSLVITAGKCGEHLIEKITNHLYTAKYVNNNSKQFTSGEIICRYQESIREDDLFIVQSLDSIDSYSCNDALMELLLLIDAAHGASAKSITVILPYYGYCRQDKKTKTREPISARLVAKMIEAAGADRVVLLDLHSGQIQGFFNIVADHLTAISLLTKWVSENYNSNDTVIVAPDAGRVKLTQKFASEIDFNYVLLEKSRPADQIAQTGYVIGDVTGKKAIIVDDIIDTGGTLASSAAALIDEGANDVIAIATHGIFSGNAKKKLENSPISKIVVTNSTPINNPPAQTEIISIESLLARTISVIYDGGSVSDIFDGNNQIF